MTARRAERALKLGAEFGYKQLKRYATWGPVAAIVRDLDHVVDADELRSNENWVGAVTWRTLLPDLRTLPVTDPGTEIRSRCSRSRSPTAI